MIDSSAYPLLWSILYEVEMIVDVIEEKGMARHISFENCGNQQASATIEHHATTSAAEAGPSRDNWEQGAEEVDHTPPPTSSLEDGSQKEAAVDTAQTLNKSDPLLQWGGEWQQEAKQRAEQTPVSVKPQKKFKAAITPSEAEVSGSNPETSTTKIYRTFSLQRCRVLGWSRQRLVSYLDKVPCIPS